MNWKKIVSPKELEELKQLSHHQAVLIFKHSTRCSISASALNRLERNWREEDSEKLSPYFLDLISFRSISNQIAQDFGVEHESPQVLVIEKGKCVYTTSHNGIAYKDLFAHILN